MPDCIFRKQTASDLSGALRRSRPANGAPTNGRTAGLGIAVAKTLGLYRQAGWGQGRGAPQEMAATNSQAGNASKAAQTTLSSGDVGITDAAILAGLSMFSICSASIAISGC